MAQDLAQAPLCHCGGQAPGQGATLQGYLLQWPDQQGRWPQGAQGEEPTASEFAPEHGPEGQEDAEDGPASLLIALPRVQGPEEHTSAWQS
eukprot:7122945-Lingulodinium_polyedra.AAC.1